MKERIDSENTLVNELATFGLSPEMELVKQAVIKPVSSRS